VAQEITDSFVSKSNCRKDSTPAYQRPGSLVPDTNQRTECAAMPVTIGDRPYALFMEPRAVRLNGHARQLLLQNV
jgi:hypothetical protein